MQIFSDINIALSHSLRMGPAKGAKVSINDSTLDDIAAEEPSMKLSLIARKAYVSPGKRFEGQTHPL